MPAQKKYEFTGEKSEEEVSEGLPYLKREVLTTNSTGMIVRELPVSDSAAPCDPTGARDQ